MATSLEAQLARAMAGWPFGHEAPSPADLAAAPLLTDYRTDSHHDRDGREVLFALGEVDGRLVRTTRIVALGDGWLRTSVRLYRLGERSRITIDMRRPDPESVLEIAR